MTIRGTLLGFGAILWLGAIVCWIRARGNWRLSREGWLFLALGAPFLVAGWFFTASSYPQERATPAPAPAVALTTAAPTPTPAIPPPSAPETYVAAVNAAQHAAVARYPALGKAGTEFNTRFVTAHRQLRASDPNYFTDPEWPLHLADEIARDLKEQ
ncbi:MAG: hypothetical protein WCF18_02605 [Chthoniobacteraceae bacterium]